RYTPHPTCIHLPMLLWLFNYNDRICERGRKGLSRGEFSPRGMEPPRPGRMPRRRRRVILVIAVSAIVVVAGFLIWDVFVRPRSLREVYGFDHWMPGASMRDGSSSSIMGPRRTAPSTTR